MKAARQEVPSLAEYLIDEAGISLSSKDHTGLTALAYSIGRQSAQTLKVLLDKGADYTIQDKRGNMVLHAAALEADLETLSVLAEYDLQGVDPDAKNSAGMTPADIVNKREDVAPGFMPVFMKMLAGIRSTRHQVRNQLPCKSEQNGHQNHKAGQFYARTTAVKVEELPDDTDVMTFDYEDEDNLGLDNDEEDEEDEEDDQFHDAIEHFIETMVSPAMKPPSPSMNLPLLGTLC
jgi:hypothetical protein